MKFVNVKDRGLRYAHRPAVGNDLTDESLNKVTQLVGADIGQRLGSLWIRVDDLTGIEYCVNLRTLSFDGNGVKSLALLAGLADLEYLNIADTGLADLSPLVDLPAWRASPGARPRR